MSGIVGMVNVDGSPVDRDLLGRMTAFLAFRGPDARATWADGPVGLGHALLRTTFESDHERQPCSLDGRVRVSADARIDDRANLIAQLTAHGREVATDVPDVELILHAYHVWGERCVEHLLGDFAFILWDGRERRLFCARDHFGVKPFYYARAGDCLVVGNTLNCVRLHPGVSDRLNDQAIGDYLLFGSNQDKETSAFADVRRLPPAHVLEWSGGAPRLRRYWELPRDGEVRYRRAGDYVAKFTELFSAAVGDRLRASRVSISLSGGMDSSSVAATAVRLASSWPQPVSLRASSYVFDQLIPDRERHYAGLVAEALKLPIDFLVADNYGLFERWDTPELSRPEPFEGAAAAALVADQLRTCAAHSRVLLAGDGGDHFQTGSATYALDLLKRGRWSGLAADVWQSVKHRQLPKVGLRARLRRWLRTKVPWQFPYPEWIEPDFGRRLGLAERLRAVNAPPPAPHPRRREAYAAVMAPEVVNWFESRDPGTTGCAVETCYPYFDVRVAGFLLAIPPVPWCDNKLIVREAMRGLLPEAVRRRPKTPLAGEPVRELLRQEASSWVDRFVATEELGRYVVREAVPPVAGETDLGRIWTNLRPLSLQYWLSARNRFRQSSLRKVTPDGAEEGSVCHEEAVP